MCVIMHVQDLQLIVSNEWRRETECQSCLKEMHCENGIEI